MPIRRMSPKWSLLALPVLMLFLAGCPFDPKKDTKDPPIINPDYVPNTSISNVLANLKTSYNKQNIEEYKALLHPNYMYIFDPRDVGTHGIPESWIYADEVESATHLFEKQPNSDGYKMETMTLNFTTGSDTQSEVEPGWRKVTLTQIMLLVDTVHKDNGDPLRYEVLGDQADIHLIQTDETDPNTHLKLWKIIYWVDRPVGLLLAAKN